jgi:biotin carboxyl carrier protein
MSILSKPANAFARMSPFFKGLTIIAIGVLGFVLLMVFRPRPEAQEPPRRVPLVVTAPADVRSGNLTIRGYGSVRPKSQIVLSSQVAGRVEWVSTAFASGGRFEKGDLLLRIERADYVNRVDAASAAVAQRQVEVLQWEEEQALAREEYQRLLAREGMDAPDSASLSSLIFREPQLQAAQASLRSAEAQLADARLALGRTRIIAPFDGIVRAKSVDVGQYVAPGQNLGSLYDTDVVEIVVPLTDAEAALVEGLWDAGAGDEATRIPATVLASFGGREYEWPAYVDREPWTWWCVFPTRSCRTKRAVGHRSSWVPTRPWTSRAHRGRPTSCCREWPSATEKQSTWSSRTHCSSCGRRQCSRRLAVRCSCPPTSRGVSRSWSVRWTSSPTP